MHSVKQSESNINATSRKTKIAWKKDNGRHIRDHGLAMDFADSAKTAFLRNLCGKDGLTVIPLGKSEIAIETIGRVSRVRFFDAIGNGFWSHSIHYFSPLENLRFSIVRDEGNAKAFAVLNRAIFGFDWSEGIAENRAEKYTAPVLRCASGAAQDDLRSWAATFAWTLSGEAGMRAKALEKRDSELKDAVEQAAYLLEDKTRQLENAKTRDFREEHKRLRSSLFYLVQSVKQQEEEIKTGVAAVQSIPDGYFTESVEYSWAYSGKADAIAYAAQNTFGASFSSILIQPLPEGPKRYLRSLFFPARNASFSHELITPNYRVSRAENGTLRLSSGIVCPFSEADALAWLRGERPAPQTQYGTCHLVKGRDESARAVVLVGCGCHRVDVAADLGGDFAESLKPDFVVRQTSGTPAIHAEKDLPAFLAKCEEIAAAKLREENERLSRGIADFRARRKTLFENEGNQPAYLAQLEAELVARKTALAEAEAAQTTGTTRFPGARLADLQAQNRAALSAFVISKL